MKKYYQVINGAITEFTMKDKLKNILPKLDEINKYYNKSFTEEEFIKQCEDEYEKGRLVFRQVDNYIKQLETKFEPILGREEHSFGHYEALRTGLKMYVANDLNQSYKGPVKNDWYYRQRALERLNRILEGE